MLMTHFMQLVGQATQSPLSGLYPLWQVNEYVASVFLQDNAN